MLSAMAGPTMRKQVNAACSKLIVVMTLLLVQLNVAIAQSDQVPVVPNKESDMQNQTSNKWGPPYPFTPDEIQDKLMQVLKVPADELSKEKVEAIFEMKMVNSHDDATDWLNMDSRDSKKNTKWHGGFSQSKIDWYFFLGINVIPNKTFFRFGWWDFTKPAPNPIVLPMCVNLQKLSEAIEHTNMGWKLVHLPLTQPLHGYVDTSLHFTKSGTPWDFASIKVEYLNGSNCMTALAFQINTQ
jgi:hypothetical protein